MPFSIDMGMSILPISQQIIVEPSARKNCL